jgi:hypothetical protein
MPDTLTRASVIQETLDLLGTDAPDLRQQVEVVVDHLPHIFSYAAEQRAHLVRFHVLRLLQQLA